MLEVGQAATWCVTLTVGEEVEERNADKLELIAVPFSCLFRRDLGSYHLLMY